VEDFRSSAWKNSLGYHGDKKDMNSLAIGCFVGAGCLALVPVFKGIGSSVATEKGELPTCLRSSIIRDFGSTQTTYGLTNPNLNECIIINGDSERTIEGKTTPDVPVNYVVEPKGNFAIAASPGTEVFVLVPLKDGKRLRRINTVTSREEKTISPDKGQKFLLRIKTEKETFFVTLKGQ
jgi:hypothetical protein